MKLHTGDTVVIISGKDKGKTGSILRVIPNENRVVVTGLNIRTKHVKKTAQEAGRILKYESSIHASNVMAIDPKTKKRTRLGTKIDAKGNKTRIARKSGEVVVKVAAAKVAPKKETKATKETKESGEAKKSLPFWKKGKNVATTGDVDMPSNMEKDNSIPDQIPVHRIGGRGS